MNVNMEQAKTALQAELAHAVLGIEYWSAKANNLREMIAKIDNIEREPIATSVDDAQANGAVNERLPSTGRDFWVKQFTAVQQSSAQILDASIQSLGLTPTKDTKKRFANRLATAIQVLTKDGTVIAHGEGKRRTFTKAKGH
jgi:hypothetical protein